MKGCLSRRAVVIAKWLLLGTLVCLFGCSKRPLDVAGAGASEAGPSARSSYGPAVLEPQSCLKEKSSALPGVLKGCEACSPEEHCKRIEMRGQVLGACMKDACQKDADCNGALCVCGPPHECIPGNCRGPRDCGGRDCVFSRNGSGTGYCRTDRDTCKTSADCGPGNECAFNGTWLCRKEPPPPPPG